jgi:ribosome assembly protein YihI (activator of Der GTPase)
MGNLGRSRRQTQQNATAGGGPSATSNETKRLGVQVQRPCRRARTASQPAVSLIVSANVSRRHLSKSQRAMALAKIEGLSTQETLRARYVLN